VTDFKLVQPENAFLPTETADLGTTIDVSALQSQNAPFSIEVTESGIVIDSTLHLKKALAHIFVAVFGIE